MEQSLTEMLLALGLDPTQYEEGTKPIVPSIPTTPTTPNLSTILGGAPIEAVAGERIPSTLGMLGEGYKKWQATRGFPTPEPAPTPAPTAPVTPTTLPVAPTVPAGLPPSTVTAPLTPQKTEQILEEGAPGAPGWQGEARAIREPKEGEIRPTEEGLVGIEQMYEKPTPTEALGIAAMPTEKYMTPEDYAKQAETIRAESKAKALAISQKERPTVQGRMDAAGKSRMEQLIYTLSYNLFGGDSRKLYEKIDTQLQADFDRQTLEELKQNGQDEMTRTGLLNLLLKSSDEKRTANTQFLFKRLETQPELLAGPNAEKNLLLLSNQLGWTPESTKAYIESNRDPKTGKLNLGYLSEADRWLQQKQDMATVIKKLMPNLPDGAATEVAVTGKFSEWMNDYEKIMERRFRDAPTPEDRAKVATEMAEWKRYKAAINLDAIKGQIDMVWNLAARGLIDPTSAKRFTRDYIAGTLAGKETVKGMYVIEQERIEQEGETARKGIGAGTENLNQKRVQILNSSEGRTIQFLNPGLINQAAAGEAGAEGFTKEVANMQGIIRSVGNDPRAINKNLAKLPPETQEAYLNIMRAQRAAIGSSTREGGLNKTNILSAIGGGASASELDAVMRMIQEGKPDREIVDAVTRTRALQAQPMVVQQ